MGYIVMYTYSKRVALSPIYVCLLFQIYLQSEILSGSSLRLSTKKNVVLSFVFLGGGMKVLF